MADGTTIPDYAYYPDEPLNSTPYNPNVFVHTGATDPGGGNYVNEIAAENAARQGRIKSGFGADMGPIYGSPTVEGRPDVIVVKAGYLYIRYLFGLPVSGMTSIYIDEANITSFPLYEWHPAGITSSALLSAAIVGYAVGSDDAAGYACCVVRITISSFSGQFPRAFGRLLGRKIYDPTDGSQVLATPSTWTYSANAVLVAADLLRDSDYGAGLEVDWAAVTTAKAFRTSGGSSIDWEFHGALQGGGAKPISAWLSVLLTHAGCWWHKYAGEAVIIADAPRALEIPFTYPAKEFAAVPVVSHPRFQAEPSAVRVSYTVQFSGRSDGKQWVDAEVTGSTDDRQASVHLYGCIDVAQARAVAALMVQRSALQANAYRLTLWRYSSFGTADWLIPGMVIKFEHPILGGGDATIRILRVYKPMPATAGVDASAYDADIYTETGLTITEGPALSTAPISI